MVCRTPLERGGLRAMLILHVDVELMVTSDGSREMRKLTEDIHREYPFAKVDDEGCVYTWRRRRVADSYEIMIDQTEFIHGRLTLLPSVRGSPDENRRSLSEVALFRSAVGSCTG